MIPLFFYIIIFQLTRSHGAWLILGLPAFFSCAFQLTRSRGAWPYSWISSMLSRRFQLTRSRGAWPDISIQPWGTKVISTHTLTWSVTIHIKTADNTPSISTHTLTWSVTLLQDTPVKLVQFQLTRSRGAWPAAVIPFETFADFNSHAHVERDSGTNNGVTVTTDFNSHAHVERDGGQITQGQQIFISTHTLTWSVTCYCL